VREGCTEVVELLIERGADLSVVDKVAAAVDCAYDSDYFSMFY